MSEVWRSPFDVYYCTNAVNATVALHGVLPGRARRAVLLYKGRRLRPEARPGVWRWRVSLPSLLALRALARVRPLGTVFTPHHHLPSQLRALLPRAQGQAFIDDGLDTLRVQPRNIDVAALVGGTPYHTFSEYTALPAWLAGLAVRRGCSLALVARASTRPPLPLHSWQHVFFESPGLDPAALVQALGLPPAQVLVVRHPVLAKQGRLPEGCASVPGEQANPEATMLAARGRHFYFGETMAAVFALHCGPARHNTLWLQLSAAQRANLHGLPLLQPAGLPGLAAPLWVSHPAQAACAQHVGQPGE